MARWKHTITNKFSIGKLSNSHWAINACDSEIVDLRSVMRSFAILQYTPGILSTVCDPGFYASAVLESCVRCPNNSNSTQSGLSECPCDEGYYRTPQEVDLPCTRK